MTSYRYQILNVFTQEALSGNPLCVFESAIGLDDETMLKLAKQFNLSETVFLFPSQHMPDELDCKTNAVDYSLRIFTPSYELPFAGHPVIGSALVASKLLGGKTSINFKCQSGLVEVNYNASNHDWTLKTPKCALKYQNLTQIELQNLKHLLNINTFSGTPAFVDTGSEQLIIPLSSAKEVDEIQINMNATESWPSGQSGRKTAYLFALETDSQGNLFIYSRFLFLSHTGAVGEDPGTGSACANLGYWLVNNNYPLPIVAQITQGVMFGRKCQLSLKVETDFYSDMNIFVGGQTIKVAEGTYFLN